MQYVIGLAPIGLITDWGLSKRGQVQLFLMHVVPRCNDRASRIILSNDAGRSIVVCYGQSAHCACVIPTR